MIKKYNEYEKVNEELYDGEQLIKHRLQDLDDDTSQTYYDFIEKYNDLILEYNLKVSNFHGDVAIYDVNDQDNYEKILIVGENQNGLLFSK